MEKSHGVAKNQAEWSAVLSHSFHCIMCWGMWGGWVRTPTEPAGIAALQTHRDFCGMFFPWIHRPWGMLAKPSHPHVGPDCAHVLSPAGRPLRFQMCLGGIYRCRVGIVQSTSANVNSNYVKKMPVAFSEEEHFSILAMPSPWIVALSQNLKTSVCRQLACSAFHGTKGIDKTTLLHPSSSCQHLDEKIGFFAPFNPFVGGVGGDYTVIFHVQFTVLYVWLEILLAAWVFQRLRGNERMQLSLNYSGSFLAA